MYSDGFDHSRIFYRILIFAFSTLKLAWWADEIRSFIIMEMIVTEKYQH